MMAFWLGASAGFGFSTRLWTASNRGSPSIGRTVQAAIRGNRIAFDDLRPEDGRPGLLIRLDHLPDARRLRIHDVIRQDHGERLVTDDFLRLQHRVPQPQRLGLTCVHHAGHAGDRPHRLQHARLAARAQQRLQLRRAVEVVFHRDLIAARDENDFCAAGSQRLFYAVLNQRFINQRQHLLRDRLGCGEKSRAHPGSGKNSLADLHGSHCLPATPVIFCLMLAGGRSLAYSTGESSCSIALRITFIGANPWRMKLS